jgi:hypothetical protein
LQKRAVARIAFNIPQQPFAFDFSEAAIALLIGALELFKGFVRIAMMSVNLRNLVSPIILKLFDVLRQRSISFLRSKTVSCIYNTKQFNSGYFS